MMVPRDAFETASPFKLSRELTIGVAEGDPDYVLYQTLPGFRDSSGCIFLGHGGDEKIRVYDASGRLLTSFGGRGEAPGEFLDLRWVRAYGPDSLAALDGSRRTISVFDREGGYGRSIRLSMIDLHQQLTWFETDGGGAIFYSASSGIDPREHEGRVVRDSVSLVRIDPTTGDANELVVLPDRWWRASRRSGGFGLSALMSGPMALQAVDRNGQRVITATNDLRAVRFFDRFGRATGEWRDPRPEIAWVPGENVGATDAAGESDPQGRYYDQIVVGSRGEWWLGDYVAASDSVSTWTVVAADGSVQARVQLPASARVWQVDKDFALLMTTDRLGVEHVELWRRDDGDSIDH